VLVGAAGAVLLSATTSHETITRRARPSHILVQVNKKMNMRLTERQKLVLRMLSLAPGGTSMAYLVYSLTGRYPNQTRGEVPSWKNTFVALRKRRLVVRRFDYTHWNWSLHAQGTTVVHEWLVRAHKRSLSV
jgi:hypothetical protein